MTDSNWRVFDVEAELEKRIESSQLYREFLRVPALSCGIYTLPAGSKDLQAPHDEDEIYYVLGGRARVRIDEKIVPVRPGSILYIQSTSAHSFFEIEKEITLLVFFASGGPAEADTG